MLGSGNVLVSSEFGRTSEVEPFGCRASVQSVTPLADHVAAKLQVLFDVFEVHGLWRPACLKVYLAFPAAKDEQPALKV